MEEKQKVFDEFMNEFLKLDIDQKNSEIVDKLKTILGYLLKYAEDNEIDYQFLKSKEINDIASEDATYADYLEAMMVYIQNIEELTGMILLTMK